MAFILNINENPIREQAFYNIPSFYIESKGIDILENEEIKVELLNGILGKSKEQ